MDQKIICDICIPVIYILYVIVFFRCAELLVRKAELELMRGKIEESGFDLDRVRDLLEPGTGQQTTQHCQFIIHIELVGLHLYQILSIKSTIYNSYYYN